MARRLVFLAALICLVHGQGSQGGAPSRKNAPTSGSDDSNMPTSGSDGSSSVSSDCDICGTTTTYVEEIVNDDDLGENSVRSISGNGCPNHYSVCTGKDGITGCGGTGEEGTDTEASDQDFAYTLPAYPVLRDDDPYDIEYEMGTIGVALNGVSIYSGAVAVDELLDITDETSEWIAFDMCSGHAEKTGQYHYHFPPSCLLAQAEADNPSSGGATGHSPQIGWALDGFPVYGPRYTGDVSASLYIDDCSGIEEEIPDLDNFKYRYYMTGDTSDLYSLPSYPMPAESDYPYSFKCYMGCVYDDLVDGSCTGTAGYTDDYTPFAAAGYTDSFDAYGTSGTNFFGNTYSSAFITSEGTCVDTSK